MTMIELLVAVSIMVIMMVAFSQILSQARKVVSHSQLTMRYNAAATAIIHTIRSDIRKATKHGMLSITQTDMESAPVLTLTAAGLTPSKTAAVTGSGAFATYGVCENKVTAKDEIFYCQRWVLNDSGATGDDVWQMDLAAAQIMDRQAMNDTIVGTVSDNTTLLGMTPDASGNTINIPPVNIGQVGNLWQVLAVDCRALSIMWTDGSTDPTTQALNWYGVDYTMDPGTISDDYTDDFPLYTAVGQNLDGLSTPPYPEDWIDIPFNPTPGTPQIEFDTDPNTGTGVYRALWTHHNQNNWPVAIKIRFELLDTRDADKPRPKTYEVICPLGG